MTNTNCLAGVRCPECGQDGRFAIAATITCLVTDDGSDPVGDHDWDDGSHARCPACGFTGTLGRFRSAPPPGGPGTDGRP